MMTMAKPKVSAMPLEFSSSVAASASGSRRAPGGSSGAAISRHLLTRIAERHAVLEVRR
jgi:hypothetical protein